MSFFKKKPEEGNTLAKKKWGQAISGVKAVS